MSKAAVIPFYGARDPRLFAIERRAMDADGRVIAALDALLPGGLVLDVGAGNGWTASRLTRPGRTVLPLEPAWGMIEPPCRLPWVQGIAQQLPLGRDSLAGAYATWAYFFPAVGHGDAGLAELLRAVRPGGPIVIADNAGGDEFCALFQANIASDPDWWQARGFRREIVHTHFRFDSLAQAEELLAFYWQANGRRPGSQPKVEIEFAVALYIRQGH